MASNRKRRVSVTLKPDSWEKLEWIKGYCRAMGQTASNSLVFSLALTFYKWYLTSLVNPRPSCPGCGGSLDPGSEECPRCKLKLKWLAIVQPLSPHEGR